MLYLYFLFLATLDFNNHDNDHININSDHNHDPNFDLGHNDGKFPGGVSIFSKCFTYFCF